MEYDEYDNITDADNDNLMSAQAEREYAFNNSGIPRWRELIKNPHLMTLGEMQDAYTEAECGGTPGLENEWFERENDDGKYNHLKKHYK